MTINVRGLHTSHLDLGHAIATHNPDVLTLTETKLKKSSKPRAWLDNLHKNYKWWTAHDKETTICVRTDIVSRYIVVIAESLQNLECEA
eukprot:47429-Pelagomonas_calceolata.AAC.1